MTVITRKMVVEERTEKVGETRLELRRRNGVLNADDRITIVCVEGEEVPEWRVGSVITIMMNVEAS